MKKLWDHRRATGIGICFGLAVLVTFLTGCLWRDWGRGIARISFVPDLVERLGASQGKAVLLDEGQVQELMSCLRGPVKKDFSDNKYQDLQDDVWAMWWQNVDGIVEKNKVYLVRYSEDNRRFKALAFDSSGELMECCGGVRGSAAYAPLDNGPLR